jgi:hypothetical protein
VADTLSRPPPAAAPGNQSGPPAQLAARPVATGLHTQREGQTPEGLPAREPEGLSLTATVSLPATSPVTAPPPPAPVDLEELAVSQASCEDCNRARSSTAGVGSEAGEENLAGGRLIRSAAAIGAGGAQGGHFQRHPWAGSPWHTSFKAANCKQIRMA